MSGIMDKTKFIKSVVNTNNKEPKTLIRLRGLLTDSDPLPIYKFPVSVLATAALILLEEMQDKPNDADVQLMKEVLLNV